jgi:hypothetical protein
MHANVDVVERLRKLRLLVETQAELCIGMLDGAIAEIENAGLHDPVEVDPVLCVACKERDPEKIEDTTYYEGDKRIKRMTCLTCGLSRYPTSNDDSLHLEVPANG